MKQALRRKKEKGITLIALVITIIILLILAGVTIAALTGDNGILSNAGNAKIESRAATIEERVKVWQAEEMINQYTNQNEKTFEELLEELREEELITKEEKEIFKEKGHLVIGSKDITISEGIKKPEYTITSSLDEVKFSKTIEEADIAAEKPRFENYKIEGISSSKEGEYISTGSIEGKSGNLEIVGDISDATFKYNLTDFMQGDEIFYCKINIDNEDYYQEIKVNQGEVVTYEEDFAGITYTGPWQDEENESFTNGKAKWTDDITTKLNFQMYGTGVDIRTVKGQKIGSFSLSIIELDQNNNLGQLLHFIQLSFKDTTNTTNEIVNFSDLMKKRIYFDKNDNKNVKKVQMNITKMKANAQEQTGDSKVYIDAIYVYR